MLLLAFISFASWGYTRRRHKYDFDSSCLNFHIQSPAALKCHEHLSHVTAFEFGGVWLLSINSTNPNLPTSLEHIPMYFNRKSCIWIYTVNPLIGFLTRESKCFNLVANFIISWNQYKFKCHHLTFKIVTWLYVTYCRSKPSDITLF